MGTEGGEYGSGRKVRRTRRVQGSGARKQVKVPWHSVPSLRTTLGYAATAAKADVLAMELMTLLMATVGLLSSHSRSKAPRRDIPGIFPLLVQLVRSSFPSPRISCSVFYHLAFAKTESNPSLSVFGHMVRGTTTYISFRALLHTFLASLLRSALLHVL